MSGFEMIDHTGDIGIKVWGSDWIVILETTAKAMMSLILPVQGIRPLIQKEVIIEGYSREEILILWLREILFFFEQGIVFSFFRVEEDNFSCSNECNFHFRGILRGEKIDNTRHDICREIKAVTRHQLSFEKVGSNWEARILFDV